MLARKDSELPANTVVETAPIFIPARPPVFEELNSPRSASETSLSAILKQKSQTTLLWKSGEEKSEALIFKYAQTGVPQQIFRWTGWAGGIGDHVYQLEDAARAFQGVKGFHVFGGTQMRDLKTEQLLPTVCDLPAVLKRRDPELVLIGVIPKVKDDTVLDEKYGVILSSDPDKGHFTYINRDQNIGIVLQPDVNGHYEWIDEIKESRRQCMKLAEKGWPANLVAFGGTPTPESDMKLRNVEQELVWWAEDAQSNPDLKINIFLMKGSGGVADLYANNKEWLQKNPNVHVLELNAHSIHSQLDSLGIASDWNSSKRI